MVMRGDRLRVCHVISADLWAGAAAQVYETVTDLRARGVGVSVAVFNDGIFARRVSGDGVAWTLLDEKRLGTLGLARALARFIAEQDPQCLHVHAYKEHIVGALARLIARRQLPIVRTVHGKSQVPSTLSLSRRVRSEAVGWFERRLLRRAVLIAVSRDLERFLRQAYPAARVELVPNGVRVPAAAGTREKARARWSVREDAFWIGCVARLEPVKNLPCLIRAVGGLREALPGLRVSIFGTGSQRAALQDLVAAEGVAREVALHGTDDDMLGTMAGFDCFVLSSTHEGLPMSLLEAMARGVPPVCSRVGGMAELIAHGKTGLLFESNDDSGLASCLKQIHDSKDAATQMGRAARAFISEFYCIEVTDTALLRVYESVIAGHGLAEQQAESGAHS